MAKMINGDNYYQVYYWMSTDLKLSGVPKDLYAIIYRFSMGKAGCCYYGYSDLAKITGASKNTVIRSLAKLEEDGLIEIKRVLDDKGHILKSFYRILDDKLVEIEGVGLLPDPVEGNLWKTV